MSIAKLENVTLKRVDGILWRDIGAIWPHVSAHIQSAIDDEDCGVELDDLLQAVLRREKQLWVINQGEAAAITAIYQLPLWSKLVIEFLGGSNMQEWIQDYLEEMHAFGKFKGCTYLESAGRKGWVKIFEQMQVGEPAPPVTICRRVIK